MQYAWISLLLGTWLIISGLISGLQVPINLVLPGMAIAFLGMYLLKGWEGLVNSLIGIWIFICGFVPGLITKQNILVLGIVVSIMSLIKISHLHRVQKIEHTSA